MQQAIPYHSTRNGVSNLPDQTALIGSDIIEKNGKDTRHLEVYKCSVVLLKANEREFCYMEYNEQPNSIEIFFNLLNFLTTIITSAVVVSSPTELIGPGPSTLGSIYLSSTTSTNQHHALHKTINHVHKVSLNQRRTGRVYTQYGEGSLLCRLMKSAHPQTLVSLQYSLSLLIRYSGG